MSDGMFTVLTNFHFDVADAVADSHTLQDELGKISSAADQALGSLQQFSIGFLSHIGVGTGSFVGMIYSAITAVDKFDETQRRLATSFMANGLFSGDDAFLGAMRGAAKAMDNMNAAAKQFNLPVDEVVQLSTVLGNSLVMQGADKSNLLNSTNLATSFMRAAPILGINQQQGHGELLEMISGRIHPHSRVFNRLAQGNPELQKYAALPGVGGGMTSHGMLAWQALSASQRVDLLTHALKKFAGDAKAIEAETRSFSSQLRILKSNLTGMFSILTPIGKAFIEPLKMILFEVNQFLAGPGKELAQKFGKILSEFLKDPIKLYENLHQVSRLRMDFHRAGELLKFIWFMNLAGKALKFFGITLNGGLIFRGLAMVGDALVWVGALFLKASTWMNLFKFLNWIFEEAVAPLAIFTAYFQALSRGIAKANVINAKWLIDNSGRIAEIFDLMREGFMKLFTPIEIFLDFFSDIFAWIFRLDVTGNIFLSFLQQFAELMDFLGTVMVVALAEISAIFGAVIQGIMDLVNLNFSGMGDRLASAYYDGFEMFMKKFGRNLNPNFQENQISENKITVNGGIHINNDFKDQMEPDRIAFTLKEQLMKAATNPQQASGRSLGNGFVTRGG